MNIKEIIVQSIFKAIGEINEQLPPEQQLKKSSNTILYGKKGELDSLGLVNLLVVIEQNIEDELDVIITIADERAMSQEQSPFKTVESLVNYIDMLFKEIQDNDSD